MAVFKLGLVGAGRMGQTHLRALAASERVRVVAAAEPRAASRAALARTGLAVHADVGAMLDAGGLDGVLIAAPSDSASAPRAPQSPTPGCRSCARSRAASPPRRRAQAARIAAPRVPLQIAYWRRFVPALRHLRERIADGALGELYFVACYQWDASRPPAHFAPHSGGIFVDMGVHEFDQLRWLTGQEFAHPSQLPPRRCPNRRCPATARVRRRCARLSGGSTALVSLGRRFPNGDVCWVEVFGTRDAEECRFLWPPDGDARFPARIARAGGKLCRMGRRRAGDGARPRTRSPPLRRRTGFARAEQVSTIEEARNGSRNRHQSRSPGPTTTCRNSAATSRWRPAWPRRARPATPAPNSAANFRALGASSGRSSRAHQLQPGVRLVRRAHPRPRGRPRNSPRSRRI